LKEGVRRIEKFMELTFREKMLFFEALTLHLWVGLLLIVVPFRWVPRLFAGRQAAGSKQQAAVIGLITFAIRRAGNVSPWKNRCLVSSLAARCMLNRRNMPSQIWLGVIKSDKNRLQAHAWIKSGEVEVVDMKREFTSLYTF